jgi:hypothetical protein
LLLASSLLAIVCLEAQQASTPPNGENNSEPFLLRMTTREVLLEVLAIDHRGHIIRDLSQDELRIFEVDGHTKTPVASISTFRAVDPSKTQGATETSLRATVGGGCAARATFHYEIAYHPGAEGWHGGYHEVAVEATRPGVRLYYRGRYYAAETTPLPHPPAEGKVEAGLQETACYHSSVPASVALSARPVATASSDALRYFVTIDADSLASITMAGQNRRVQLDYGVCTFDAAGHGLRYMHAEIDRLLNSSEYAEAVVHGFSNLLEFPRVDKAALARVVMRDRSTGNVGLVDITLAPQALDTLTSDEENARIIWEQRSKEKRNFHDFDYQAYPMLGPIGAFGSLQSRPGALCGDVYEISQNAQAIPVFWNLSSIGSLYADVLNVPHQQFWNTGGLPGITRRTEFFGIDYHGTIWISSPGEYEFELQVDDGARLFIDDQQVIDLDGLHMLSWKRGKIKLDAGLHAIHVPYIQGPPNAVALVLLVKGPGDSDFKPFDMRDFDPTARDGNATQPKAPP